MLFTAVVLGIVDEAVGVARTQLRRRADDLRAYEQVEWARAEQDHWLAVQATRGDCGLRRATTPTSALHGSLRAKQAVAGLAEDTLRRLSTVLGGGTFSRRSPFSHWSEDVRALGFLRPPWGLAYDNLFATSFLPGDEVRAGGTLSVMPLFLVERNFAEGAELTAADVSGITAVNDDAGVRWVYSFLSADKRKTYCLYEAPTADAIRRGRPA